MFQSYALFPHLSCLDNVAFSLQDARRRQGRARMPRRGNFLALVHMDGFRRPAAGAAFGRPAAARRAGPLADHPAEGAAARRAALGARSVPAHQGARGTEAAAARARHHLHPRHPQPGRGDGAGRPDGGDGGRPYPPGRHRRARCSSGRPAPSSRASSAATTCCRTPAGPIAVRADRCRLGRPGPCPHVRVVAVEYQGTAVRVALRTDAGGEAAALLPDRDFDDLPVLPGTATHLSWSPTDERRLAA